MQLLPDLEIHRGLGVFSCTPMIPTPTPRSVIGSSHECPLVVAQWISMEYYFSAVDPTVYGSGSKVTHNIVSGVGVMLGSHGDLRSRLPLQSMTDGDKVCFLHNEDKEDERYDYFPNFWRTTENGPRLSRRTIRTFYQSGATTAAWLPLDRLLRQSRAGESSRRVAAGRSARAS
jgi:hypothetical protein